MLIIGEKINSSHPKISRAIAGQDAAYLQKLAQEQVAGGAQMLDVNCGTVKNEPAAMDWLVKIIQEKVQVPLVIDSPNPEAIEAGLSRLSAGHQEQAMVNSITAEKERFEKILPLVKKYNAGVIALTMNEQGIPRTALERFTIAQNLQQITGDYKIPLSNLYIDPLVQPVASEPQQVIEFLESLRLIKTLPKAQTICGLSNVSFGLPNRSLLNAIFIAMCFGYGLDAAIIDPTDKNIMGAVRAAEALLNKDEYCLNYIKAYRESQL
ncbi:MAG: methyltetrahydrofolate cobalamin methyltransferase [Planctomycetota bacterium]